MWYGVDPLSEKTPSWNPYRYGFNNPIRIIDPTGMGEEEAKFPPKNFTGNSWCDSDGCFNRTDKNKDYKWTDNEGKDKGVYSSMTPEVKEDRSWNNKLLSATENFYGVKEQDLRGEGGKEAVMKIAGKEASIILNIFSFGEGAAALQGASALGIGLDYLEWQMMLMTWVSDLFGFNTFDKLMGEGKSDITKGINGILGLSSSIKANLKTAFPSFAPKIGNIGDMKDLNEIKQKYQK
ncbi:MAG: hypothetical protein IPP06_03275 [Saprospiraceae bacterium]|nr:hypothetical protein [Candidatus Vicinibacter affinis]